MSVQPQQPAQGRASGSDPAGSDPSAGAVAGRRARRPRARQEGGTHGPTGNDKLCGAERRDVPTDSYDSPPGREQVYRDLDATEGQSHE